MKELEYPFDNQLLLNKRKQLKKQLLEVQGGLAEKRIAILSGSTVGEIKDILELFLLHHEIKPTFFVGSYNRYYEDSVFDNPELQEFKPDFVYLHVTVKNLSKFIDNAIKNLNTELPKAMEIFEHYKEVINALLNRYHCPVIINNFEAVPYRVLGNADVWHPQGELMMINEVNQLLYQYVRTADGIYINDLNYEAAFYGLERWFNNTLWYMYKYPYAVDAIPLVCYNVANIVKSILGKNQKVIALDLDNTIWGGVIGDDGIESIELGPDTSKGMAFEDFQRYLYKLRKLGIVLTICSKNDENIARTGLLHPSCLLKPEDFLIIKANWQPKSKNLRNIAGEMNVNTDSIVFVDDNPVEREQVNMVLPEVKVVNLTNIEEYVNEIDRKGYFEIVKLTQDDLNRNEYYRQNVSRKDEEYKYTDYGEFLTALKMKAFFEEINDNNMSRVVQLINKTNQFNLTTRRFTQEEFEDYLSKDETFSFCGKLIDKYGDNGIVIVLLCERKEEELEIVNWIMSCRVFKRDLELAVFDELVTYCRRQNVKTIKGVYIPTSKNQYVEGLYSSLGFHGILKDDSKELWEYVIPDHIVKLSKYIECSRKGF